eukprot:3270677-Amphidinium_carterae.1
MARPKLWYQEAVAVIPHQEQATAWHPLGSKTGAHRRDHFAYTRCTQPGRTRHLAWGREG